MIQFWHYAALIFRIVVNQRNISPRNHNHVSLGSIIMLHTNHRRGCRVYFITRLSRLDHMCLSVQLQTRTSASHNQHRYQIIEQVAHGVVCHPRESLKLCVAGPWWNWICAKLLLQEQQSITPILDGLIALQELPSRKLPPVCSTFTQNMLFSSFCSSRTAHHRTASLLT